ncbi:MAG: type III pantothenate kinase [Bacteroidales bacterium]|nr:type III pantothenate kinase [Bacteroidales bacterium]
MDLVVDAGNSTVKLYAFEANVLRNSLALSYDDFFSNSCFYESYLSAKQGIICNVSKYDSQKIVEQLSPVCFTEFTHETPCLITNAYKTPHTLGLDRLAAAIGAEALSPQRNKLIIDIGTAMTIDFVDETGRFVGGNISLGLETRFRALHEFTGKLPLCSETENVTLMGKTTEEAIRNGVVQGMLYEIEGYIREYESKYQDVAVFLTGGGSHSFEKRIKNLIFANKNLVALGLYATLLYVSKAK